MPCTGRMFERPYLAGKKSDCGFQSVIGSVLMSRCRSRPCLYPTELWKLRYAILTVQKAIVAKSVDMESMTLTADGNTSVRSIRASNRTNK